MQVEEKKKRDEEQLVTAVFTNILNIITKTSTDSWHVYKDNNPHRKELLSTTSIQVFLEIMLDVKKVYHDYYDAFKNESRHHVTVSPWPWPRSPCHRVQALRESEEEARLREEGVDDVESIGVDPLDERY